MSVTAALLGAGARRKGCSLVLTGV
jgi:hypothetical protein